MIEYVVWYAIIRQPSTVFHLKMPNQQTNSINRLFEIATMCTTKARHTHYMSYKSANKSQRDIRLNFVCVLFVSLIAIKKKMQRLTSFLHNSLSSPCLKCTLQYVAEHRFKKKLRLRITLNSTVLLS